MKSVIELRRNFHQHPEVGFTEFRTAGKVVKELLTIGYEVAWGPEVMEPDSRLGVPSDAELAETFERALRDGADPAIIEKMRGGNTAVVATLRKGTADRTVAFRFDIDALPVIESDSGEHRPQQNGFRSSYEGNMHACGHDGHTAIGMVLAAEMARTDFDGTLKIIFQPSEEGGRGAKPIADKGMVDDVDRFYSLHLGLDRPLGQLCVGSTGWLATSKLKSYFTGTPAHAGAAPQDGKNALLAAATALLNIHSIPRNSKADTRVNVGVLNGGTAPNIIAYEAEMVSETRSTDQAVNDDLETRARSIVDYSGQMHGVSARTETIGRAYPLNCDAEAMAMATEAAQNVDWFTEINDYGRGTGSEDCSVLMQRVQSHGGKATYMLVGTPTIASHHNSAFDIDERILQPSVDLCVGIATRELK